MAELVTKVGETKVAGVAKLTNKDQVVAMYKEKLGSNAAWACAGLMRIYANQTADEQVGGYVAHNNGIGFVHTDAEILTSFAKQFEKNHRLSEKQMAILFKKMPKYARQLMNYSLAAGTLAKVDGEYKTVKKA